MVGNSHAVRVRPADGLLRGKILRNAGQPLVFVPWRGARFVHWAGPAADVREVPGGLVDLLFHYPVSAVLSGDCVVVELPS